MKTVLGCLALSLLSSLSFASSEVKNKEEAVASVEKRKTEMIRLSDQIWGFAETALRESKSSKALADYAERLLEGLVEYALEEKHLLVARAELDALKEAIRQLEERLEGLHSRVDRLDGSR